MAGVRTRVTGQGLAPFVFWFSHDGMTPFSRTLYARARMYVCAPICALTVNPIKISLKSRLKTMTAAVTVAMTGV